MLGQPRAGHLLLDCAVPQVLSERAARNRKLFLEGLHPADEGATRSRRIPVARPLLASDPEVTWLRLG
eukprot:5863326-Pyramimonas_sp.AAC.1